MATSPTRHRTAAEAAGGGGGAPLPDAHEMVAFDDPHEHRTWVFDVTFLTSSWSCIYGHGCPGVLTGPAPDLEQGCCSYGAHMTDDDDLTEVLRHAARLRPEQWQNHQVAARRGGPTRRTKDRQLVTRLVQGACIFHNRPGFAGGTGCALHKAALDAGERPLDWKPDVCWQMPLRLSEHVEDGHVTSTLREWRRRDWGPGGAEFHWWCTEEDGAFGGADPVYEVMRDEIVEMVGAWAYERFCAHVAGRGSVLDRTERAVALPVRRRP